MPNRLNSKIGLFAALLGLIVAALFCLCFKGLITGAEFSKLILVVLGSANLLVGILKKAEEKKEEKDGKK